MGSGDADSHAASLAGPDHWALVDCIAVVSEAHKQTGSTQGHALAVTSPLQAPRVADAPRRLEVCRQALLERNFDTLAAIVELDSDMMHSVMMTSRPGLYYWMPATLAVMSLVRALRRKGLSACYTVDAGANVHVLCPAERAGEVEAELRKAAGVMDVLTAGVGGPAQLTNGNGLKKLVR